MGQCLRRGKNACSHRLQGQCPMKKDEAIHSCKPLCHPATAPLVMGAHQSSEPARASQQPLPPKHRRAAPGSGRTEPTCREHAQQREQRQQRGNEKLGKQGLTTFHRAAATAAADFRAKPPQIWTKPRLGHRSHQADRLKKPARNWVA